VLSDDASRRIAGTYDALNAGDHDWAFYERRIGDAPLRIADVGCGTGTVAVRLATAGHTVVGVDPDQAMLEVARRRPGTERVTWIDGDAGALPGDEAFDCATMIGHAFQCLLTDEAVERTLTAVRERLRPGGRFVFESRNPATRPWTRWRGGRVRIDGEDLDLSYERISVGERIVTFETHYRFAGEHLVEHGTLGFMRREEIAERLREAGFTGVQWFGGWEAEPYDEETSAEIIAIAR
jgi:ubiquinone/menaquinone biosynthesis C-methylase UbiE